MNSYTGREIIYVQKEIDECKYKAREYDFEDAFFQTLHLFLSGHDLINEGFFISH